MGDSKGTRPIAEGEDRGARLTRLEARVTRLEEQVDRVREQVDEAMRIAERLVASVEAPSG